MERFCSITEGDRRLEPKTAAFSILILLMSMRFTSWHMMARRWSGAYVYIVSIPTGLHALRKEFWGKECFRSCFKRWTHNGPRSLRSEDGLSTLDTERQIMILDFSIQLAAASAAIAKTLGEASGDLRGFAICAAGTKDRQDRMLSKFGMAPVSGIDPVFYEEGTSKNIRPWYDGRQLRWRGGGSFNPWPLIEAI